MSTDIPNLDLIEETKARYRELCVKRDIINRSIDRLIAARHDANQRVIEVQKTVHGLTAQIDEARGGRDWIRLKKEIAMLAKALSGHLATPPAAE